MHAGCTAGEGGCCCVAAALPPLSDPLDSAAAASRSDSDDRRLLLHQHPTGGSVALRTRAECAALGAGRMVLGGSAGARMPFATARHDRLGCSHSIPNPRRSCSEFSQRAMPLVIATATRIAANGCGRAVRAARAADARLPAGSGRHSAGAGAVARCLPAAFLCRRTRGQFWWNYGGAMARTLLDTAAVAISYPATTLASVRRQQILR